MAGAMRGRPVILRPADDPRYMRDYRLPSDEGVDRIDRAMAQKAEESSRALLRRLDRYFARGGRA